MLNVLKSAQKEGTWDCLPSVFPLQKLEFEATFPITDKPDKHRPSCRSFRLTNPRAPDTVPGNNRRKRGGLGTLPESCPTVQEPCIEDAGGGQRRPERAGLTVKKQEMVQEVGGVGCVRCVCDMWCVCAGGVCGVCVSMLCGVCGACGGCGVCACGVCGVSVVCV